MSNYAYLICLDCKVMVRLGSAHIEQERVQRIIPKFFGLNFEKGVPGPIIWRMLTDHVDHALRIVTSQDAGFASLYRECTEVLCASIQEPENLFTPSEYWAFVEEVHGLAFSRNFAMGRRDFGTAGRITRRVLQELPPFYRSKLPTHLLARCPICNAQVTEPIDTFSLNGMGWWISESRGFGWFGRRIKYVVEALRPLVYKRFPEPSYHAECEHAQAVCYGVNLNAIKPNYFKAPTYVIIGSERPGVLKPFMEQAGSYAVLHTLPVGRLDGKQGYTAYFVSYFSEQKGAFEASLAPQDWYSTEFLWPYDQMDYDLLPWVEAGKLFWLREDDSGTTLRQGPPSEFPYGDMDGLVGRWCWSWEKGASLLPMVNGFALHDRRTAWWRKIAPIEEEALEKRKFE